MAALEEGVEATSLLSESSSRNSTSYLDPTLIYSVPYSYLKESFKDRRRRRMAKRKGISKNPRREKILLNGYNGNWMTSWFRASMRKSVRHPSGELFPVSGDIIQNTQLENTSECNLRSQMSTEKLFMRSTGEIHDGQTDDFVFLSDDVRSSDDSDGALAEIDYLDTHSIIANIFWRPRLNSCLYKVGDPPVRFESLWPNMDVLKGTLMESMSVTPLRECMSDLALISLRCAPLRLLRTVLELGLIDVHHEFDAGLSMLHVGCISHNFDACLYLCTLGAQRKARDTYGRKPYNVCGSSRIRKLLPSPQITGQSSFDWPGPNEEQHRENIIRQNNRIFSHLEDEDKLDEALFLLQSPECKVNDILNNVGDHIIHVLARKGLSHLSAMLSLVQLRTIDINKYNKAGMTPLMVAAEEGHDSICDVLICVLGADTHISSEEHKETSLHFAARNGHLDTICVLLRRGIDLNAESAEGLRADDMARASGLTDCADAILAARELRRKHLSFVAREGNLGEEQLYESDNVVIDPLGDTLLMTAARYNRLDNMDVLLTRGTKFIDAQNILSGKTTLSLAASLGLTDVVEKLISAGAAFQIPDMARFSTLHHAVASGHVTTTEILLEQAGCWHDLVRAIKLSPSETITRLLKEAKNRRQEMIVSPALLEGAITGNVDLLFDTLEEGDDINPLSGEGNWPAYLSAAGGHLVVLDFLAKNGGDIWGQHVSSLNTVLHAAAASGHQDVVAFLTRNYGYAGEKAAKKIINTKNRAGLTALQLAANNGFKRTVELLLDQGASTCVLDQNGELYNCTRFQGIQLILQKARAKHLNDIISAIRYPNNPAHRLRRIFEVSTDHYLCTSNGDTPLMIACQHGNVDVVKYLIKVANGVLQEVIRKRNHTCGDTVLHRTVYGGDHVAVVRLLLSIDQSLINAVNRNGYTPLHTACALGRRQIVEKLTGMPDIDVNIMDCNKRRPDDVTNNTALRHMIASVRRRQGVCLKQDVEHDHEQTNGSVYKGVSHLDSRAIDFEELNRRFLQVKLQQQTQRYAH